MNTYEERVKYATTNQGLDPLIAKLKEKDVPHTVDQTGGFCMAVTVPHDTGTWVAVFDETQWLVFWYPANAWHDGLEEPVEQARPGVDSTVALMRTPLV